MDGVADLGDVPWREIPGYLALADAYVQPGAPDDFNRYRLPSKLPEFFAMGRPVILPACNLGNELTDGEDALLLRQGDALEIAARIEQLLDDQVLARRLGERARSFALERLSWPRNAEGLAAFYRRLLAERRAGGARVIPDERLWEIEERYRGSFGVEPLSYGTVRDLADSRDHFAGLARASGDMKDLQRCWMVKAVLGTVERGGRLVEIGAGEPLVADLLSRLGHEVTVIDPYDGSGNGPARVRALSTGLPGRRASSASASRRPRSSRPRSPASTRSRSSSTSRTSESAPLSTPRGTRSLPAAARSTQSTTCWPAGAPSLTSERLEEIVGRSGLSEDELDRTRRAAARGPRCVLRLRRGARELARRPSLRRIPDAAHRLDRPDRPPVIE